MTSIKCYFEILGHGFDPQMLSNALGIEPSKTWRNGDRIYPQGRFYKQDGWSIRSEDMASLDLQEVILPVLNSLKPIAHIIVEYCDRFNLEAVLACAVYVEDDQMPAISLDKKTVQLLSALGCSLDVDILDLGPSGNGNSA